MKTALIITRIICLVVENIVLILIMLNVGQNPTAPVITIVLNARAVCIACVVIIIFNIADILLMFVILKIYSKIKKEFFSQKL